MKKKSRAASKPSDDKEKKASKKAIFEKPKTEEEIAAYDELLEASKRLKAEYSNYQKRVEREREEYRDVHVRGFILNILPVVDNLERAVTAARQHESGGDLLSGVEMVLKQFYSVLSTNGVEPINSIGEKFDPRFHDALFVQETDEVPADTVLAEVERGYMMGNKILRATKVSVSRRPEKPENVENVERSEE